MVTLQAVILIPDSDSHRKPGMYIVHLAELRCGLRSMFPLNQACQLPRITTMSQQSTSSRSLISITNTLCQLLISSMSKINMIYDVEDLESVDSSI